LPISLTGDSKLGGTSLYFSIDMRKTFLRANNDPQALNADAISLAALGISASDLLVLDAYTTSGFFHPDIAAVFSTSATLSASTNLNRVTGAVSAVDALTGATFVSPVTPATASGALATNITQDFLIENENNPAHDSTFPTFAIVPLAATHLFVSAIDDGFGTNTGNFSLAVDRPTAIGVQGLGTATFSAVNHTVDRFLLLGVGSNSDGTVTITNTSTVQVGGTADPDGIGLQGGSIVVGFDGYGQLLINGGSTVNIGSSIGSGPDFDGAGEIFVGFRDGASGVVTVSGIGTNLTVKGLNGAITLGGSDATGTLNVQSGARVAGQLLVAGTSTYSANGGTGTVNITGAGSKIELSADHLPAGSNFANAGGLALFGGVVGSVGTLNVSNGGELEIRATANENSVGMMLGGEFGSIGTATIDGVGSTLDIHLITPLQGGDSAGVLVGNRGDGTLNVRNGANLTLIGHDAQLIVSLGDDISAPDTNPPVDQLTLSEVTIESGADVIVSGIGSNGSGNKNFGAQVSIGDRYNANGRMIVDGEGSTLGINANMLGNTYAESARLTVGGEGDGELIVRNGADVTINGNDDRRPVFQVSSGTISGPYGVLPPPPGGIPAGPRTPTGLATITGVGTTLTLNSDNPATNAAPVIYVGREFSSDGRLVVSNGAQLLNDVGNSNSVTVVGGFNGISVAAPDSVGKVLVDGNGNSATLFDAGQLLVVGGGWNGNDANIFSANMSGGQGTVTVTNGATIRANDVFIGDGGTLRGNSTIDGNVFMQGSSFNLGQGAINAGTEVDGSIGRLAITGNLSIPSGTLVFDIAGTTAGVSYDQISVGGSAQFANNLSLKTSGGFGFSAGQSFVLVDGAVSGSPGVLPQTVLVDGAAPLFSYAVGNVSGDLVFEALNNGSGTSILDFGASSTNAVFGVLIDGSGMMTGGRFNGGVNVVGATTVRGSAVADNITAIGLNAISLEGRDGADNLSGGDGNDTLSGGKGSDTVDGGGGQDVIIVGNGLAGDVDLYDGGTERDLLDMSSTTNGAIWVDYGYNVISGPDMANGINLFLTVGNARVLNMDSMIGNSFNDTMRGDAGSNFIDGGAGADQLLSYSPYDTVNPYASLGDVILGGAGNDLLFSGTGNDYLDGGADNDTIEVGGGTDTIVTGTGNDTILFSPRCGTDTITDFTGGAGVVDVLKLYGFGAAFDTFAEVFAVSTQVGANTQIALTDTTIILQNFTRASLVADDFLFV
jgi:T5SS/PEP-CTERM-associated repeat protein